MFRKLYEWMLRMAGHRHALWIMAAVSFAESSFFPIPPDVMVVPMTIARRERAFLIATVCTVASVLGGAFGYAIGHYLYDSVGQWLIQLYGMEGGIESFRQRFAEYGAWIVLLKGLTPIPFKLVTIASGFSGLNFAVFMLCAFVTRGARFYLIAWLLKRYGAPIQAFIEKRLALVSWSFLIILIGGFFVVMYI
jgi:membrane protein YqaA with SNARE-associated domain